MSFSKFHLWEFQNIYLKHEKSLRTTSTALQTEKNIEKEHFVEEFWMVYCETSELGEY